jgi:predicted lipoprotein
MRVSVFLFIILLTALFGGCTGDSTQGPDVGDFDRQAILTNWADNIIIPAFTEFELKASNLKEAAIAFDQNPDEARLDTLQSAWKDAYLAFQQVSMFETGPAMTLRYRTQLNTYPTDTTEIKANIENGDVNLALPSLVNSQGFPALDFLLFGTGSSNKEVLEFYTIHSNAQKNRTYLIALTQRIEDLTEAVLGQWTDTYRDEFVANDGNGANASIDLMVNDYIFYFEKYLRAGKIGIPAGVFSGSALPSHVEAKYNGEIALELFNEALDASQNFFNGIHFQSNTSGLSLADYLDYLNTMKEGTDLAALINNQFDSIRAQASSLNSDFAQQIASNNTEMLQTYDVLQRNVVFLKVDMLQALNINVDYVDADGD